MGRESEGGGQGGVWEGRQAGSPCALSGRNKQAGFCASGGTCSIQVFSHCVLWLQFVVAIHLEP